MTVAKRPYLNRILDTQHFIAGELSSMPDIPLS